MKNPNFYAAFAVILPVSLGLGLVYLTIIGRIGAGAAVISTLALAALIGVVIFLRDFAADQALDERRSRGD
jgi:predicted lipid-binding transport protein (Tim44 family)